MTLDLTNAEAYDIETFPNAFTLRMEMLFSDVAATWEISHFRDDRRELIEHFNYLHAYQIPMFGFNNLHFDYPIIHFILNNPQATVEMIYEFAMSIINSTNRFANMIWERDRFAPQVDVFKINHFDNPAKSTSLKALQINMRSETVVDMPVEVGTILTEQQVNNDLIPYNNHDVDKTKEFVHYNMDAINFRISLIEQFGIDVMNWPDTKIGARMMEARLGDELCYDRSTGRKRPRQTPRTRIALRDIIFPYVRFDHPEFQRVLSYLNDQVLTADDMQGFGSDDRLPSIKTKGVFTDLKATVGDVDFHFGTGGIHGSVERQKFIASDEWLIRDIDVASLYPSIAIVNGLAPEHLGQRFTQVYSELPKERKAWQERKGKKCVEANSLKLASNGVYGNSNNPYSVFYDPKYMLTITVNGQLMLCMLAEKLTAVPTLKIIQINTDGITYIVRKDYEPHAAQHCKNWEALTALTLEDANYKRMWIRDVNSYIAEDFDGELKLKGAYWTPDPANYHASLSAAQPPAWHKDLSNLVSVRAAVANMVHGVDLETFIRLTSNPYDFMCRVKAKRNDTLLWGDKKIQKTSRYYISPAGQSLVKISPPAGPIGKPKKANGISDAEYKRVMVEVGWQWDGRVCTKNKSVYANRETAVQAGHKVMVCNNVADFDFTNLDFSWYVNEAKKLVIT